ncbi:MAG: peptidase C1 [bacterium]|nr:peptidase C1 [bacterium]
MRRFVLSNIMIGFFILLSGHSFAQDKAIYQEKDQDGKSRTIFTMDFSNLEKPKSADEFVKWTHLPPITQDKTGTCWCFATISFLESELARQGKTPVKLSEMYLVYWEYIEKVRRFVQEQGKSHFGEGSEHNAVLRHMKKHGLVRASDYSGLIADSTKHDHSKLFKELRNYLDYIEANNIWDENQVLSNTTMILNKYLGTPPEKILVDGNEMTPFQYLNDVLQLHPDDYVCFMSLMYAPFFKQGEYTVPDNWWHSADYYNVPLNEFYQAIADAVKNGYTVALGGDTSEVGKNGDEDVAIIPSFDIPAKLIDQSAREFRFKNKTSTDDHAIHLVGYKKLGSHTWFLIKDSGSSAHRGQLKGYYMYRDDYVKLKMLNFMVHQNAVSKLLNKF